MVKEKEKLALSINHYWVESIFSPNPIEYFTPFFFIELPKTNLVTKILAVGFQGLWPR
jgi:hypothetical protein